MIKSCFYCKICWRGGKMFFYRVSFPSSLGCPEAGFLIFLLYVRPPEDVSLELQPRAESVRQGEAERRRPSLRLWHPSCPPLPPPPPQRSRTHTPLNPPSRELPPEASSSRRPADAPAPLGKAAPGSSHMHSHQAPGLAGPRGPQLAHGQTRVEKSICTVSCATPAVTLMTRS